MLALGLIIIGILLRFLPHAPNFTPVAAIALFSGAYLNKKYAFSVPLVIMVLSDLVIGLHNVVLFTWGGFILTTFVGRYLKKKKNILGITVTSLASSLLFYLISNFGVWLVGWYPHNLKGLLDCYILALPFLRNFTLSTLLYSALFFGLYELSKNFVRESSLDKLLLAN